MNTFQKAQQIIASLMALFALYSFIFYEFSNPLIFILTLIALLGVVRIFYDYLNSENWDSDFLFTKSLGETFLKTYKKIVEDTISKKWSDDDKKMQYHRRSRYVEFNLLYDRGTLFGLKTGGNIDAILMSMPPEAKWS